MSLHPKLYNDKDFQNLTEIGKGAQGTVYLAFNSVMGSNVVLKQLDKQRFTLDNVAKEVKILRHLRDVCDSYSLCYIDFMEDKDYFYIIPEYLDKQEYMMIQEAIDKKLNLSPDMLI